MTDQPRIKGGFNLRRVQRGFTLIELMIAVGIFSLIALFAYAGLNQVFSTRILSQQTLDDLGRVQFAIRQLAMDLEQVHPRPVREEFGDTLQPAIVADLRRVNSLELTRAGWQNPLGSRRGNLQRVAYRLEDGELLRTHWYVLDRLQMNEPVEFSLLQGVAEFEVRLMNQAGNWTTSWPDPEAPAQLQLDMRPRAVEIRLAFDDPRRGEIRRLIEVLR